MDRTYKVAIVGCGRMGGFIDDEVVGYEAITLPYSHAAAYSTISNTTIVAAADIDSEKLKRFGERYGVERLYRDYRDMVDIEKPDILSIATNAPSHAEIAVYAAEHDVKAIYCEKPMCCSLEEADRIYEAVKRNDVKFNIGTLRRYMPGYGVIRRIIAEGGIGEVKTIVCYALGGLLHTHSHTIDLMLFLLGDPDVEYVQARMEPGPYNPEERYWAKDPVIRWAHVRFANGVNGYIVGSPRMYECEVCGTEGAVRSLNNGISFQWRHQIREDKWAIWEPAEFPKFKRKSGTVACIEDLIRALETNGETRGNIDVAKLGMEVAIGMAESHRRGFKPVSIPVLERSLYVKAY